MQRGVDLELAITIAPAQGLPWNQAFPGCQPMSADTRSGSLPEEARRENVNYSSLYHCIFIHIPKAAGSSVARLLSLSTSAHLTYSELRQTSFFRSYPDIPVFTVCRNPIDRFISLYYYARMPVSDYHNNLEPSKALYGAHADYRRLANASLDEAVDLLIAGELRHDSRWNHWQPQHRWIVDRGCHPSIEAGQIQGPESIPLACRVRLERLPHGLACLLGCPVRHLPHANRSHAAPLDPPPELSPAYLHKLTEFYQDDYEILGYARPD